MESLYCDYEILLRSLQNLGLNDHNSLVCNAAYSTTLDSSSNNFTTADAGRWYGGFPSSSSAWNLLDRRSQDVNRNMVVDDHNSFYWALNQIENLRAVDFNGPRTQDVAQYYCDYTMPRPRPKPRNLFMETAMTRNGSLRLQRILKEGNRATRQKIFNDIICGGVFEVMADEHGHHLFQRLLDVCDSTHLSVIFITLASNEDLFIHVALQKHGSTAVQALIKKLKKSHLVYTITSILSRRFLELMTGEQGRYVVLQCFNTFKPKENEVLYDAALHYFRELATSEHGCSALNNCLSCIGGVQRAKLLTQISQHSDFLSNDPCGNFVVQYVLSLKDENSTRIICICLESQYTHLAEKKGGSHIVEKCIRSSEFGMRSVVGALLKSEKALFRLASHQFGNYVVQTALKVTKHHNVELYRRLVMILKKRNTLLSRNVIGRHVVNRIKELEDSSVEN